MNHYPHHIGDFDRATRHLTRIERSIYRDLIDLYYDTEKSLMLDMSALCRKVLARSNEEITAVEQVLSEFFAKTPSGWYHDRCEEELEAYRANTSQKAQAGKASAEARRLKRERALNGNSTHVEHPLKTVATEFNGASTNQEPEPLTNNHIKESKDSLAASPSPAADESKPEKPQTGKRATALPEDFTPNETGRAYAKSKGVNADVELLSFRNWHGAKGSTMKDWQAAWRTWCDKAVVFGRVDGQARLTGPSDVVRITVSDGGAAAATKAMLDARERNTAPPPPEIRERMAALRQEIT